MYAANRSAMHIECELHENLYGVTARNFKTTKLQKISSGSAHIIAYLYCGGNQGYSSVACRPRLILGWATTMED